MALFNVFGRLERFVEPKDQTLNLIFSSKTEPTQKDQTSIQPNTIQIW